MFYSGKIFEQAGSSLNDNVENIIVGAVQIVATIIAALVMDKAGRRILLNLSSSIMVLSISVLGVYFYIASIPENKKLAESLDLLPVASLSLFVFAFSIGFGPIPWLMMSELFSPEVKPLASSISTSSHSCSACSLFQKPRGRLWMKFNSFSDLTDLTSIVLGFGNPAEGKCQRKEGQ